MRYKKLNSIFVAAAILTASFSWTSYANAETKTSTVTQNNTKRYIVKFKNNNVNASQVVSKYNGKFKHQFKNVQAAAVEVTKDKAIELQKDPNVAYVEEDNIVRAALSTSVDWGNNTIGLPASWQSGLTGKGIKIAVIDTGVAVHSDLAVSGGVNVITGSSTTSYVDENGHGTHVAGIIGGKGINSGVQGVAPDAALYAVKALDSSGSGYTSDIIAGIDWAIENKMDIISMSLGSSLSSISLESVVNKAYDNGLLVVAAAGNSGNASGTGTSIEYPANYSSVIAVGAVDSTNNRAYFSSTGNKLEVSAPGVNIRSTYLNGGYVEMSGTSMATPFVSGDLALLKQKYPSYTNVQLRNLLDNNIIDLGASGRDSLYGFGLIKSPVNGEVPVVRSSMPIANVSSGTYTTSKTVSLSDKTPGVTIYYTLDETIPTKNSKVYSEPITIGTTTTLKAIAIDAIGNSSEMLNLVYKIIPSTMIPTPIASAQSGTYKDSVSVKLYDKYSGLLKFYYTLDGSIPTAKSLQYMGSINIKSSSTLKAIAVDRYGNTSSVLANQYNIVKPPTAPTVNVAGGIYKTAQTITLNSGTSGVSIYYTINGSEPSLKSTKYTGPIEIKRNTILRAVAVDATGNSSSKIMAVYIILNNPYSRK